MARCTKLICVLFLVFSFTLEANSKSRGMKPRVKHRIAVDIKGKVVRPKNTTKSQWKSQQRIRQLTADGFVPRRTMPNKGNHTRVHFSKMNTTLVKTRR